MVSLQTTYYGFIVVIFEYIVSVGDTIDHVVFSINSWCLSRSFMIEIRLVIPTTFTGKA